MTDASGCPDKSIRAHHNTLMNIFDDIIYANEIVPIILQIKFIIYSTN